MFRARLAALLDIYTVVGEASCCLQNLQQLPWERQAAYGEMLQNLSLKRRALPSVKRRKGSAVLQEHEFEAALNEPDDEDVSKYWPHFFRHMGALSEQQVS